MRPTIEELGGRKVLLVASTGGHLNQLLRLESALRVDPESTWVTFDHPQSRGRLAGRNVAFVPYVGPRDWAGIFRTNRAVKGLMRETEGAVSTGAGVALGVLPQVARRGLPTVYIESVSRVQGPSATGRILATLPNVGLYTQHASWVDERWKTGPSVLAGYEVSSSTPSVRPKRLFVTLGTIKPYRFDRLIEAVLGYVRQHPGTQVVWQLGCSPRSDLPGHSFDLCDEEEFASHVNWSDVTIAHSGVGVALNILDLGRTPVLMARKRHLGEHVDDHQEQIRDELLARGLAFDAEAVFNDESLLDRASAQAVIRTGPH